MSGQCKIINVRRWFLATLLVLCITVRGLKSQNNTIKSTESVRSIMDFLEMHEKQLRFTSQKDIVLILGNTGSGKTTLGLLLTGGELKAKEIVPDSGDFIFNDSGDRIAANTTITSKTIVPDLMVDNETGTVFYDCPGFEDSRGVKFDISVSYIIQKLLKSSNKVKFVFIINHASVKNGVGDRLDFVKLVKHATYLIKDIEKYRNSVALVVNKVENRYINKGQDMVTDKKVIETITIFLQEVKTEFEKQAQNNNSMTATEKESVMKTIKFVDILLEKKNETYERIGIVRLANQVGPVNEMELIQKEKSTIKSMINETLQYSQLNDTDFDYTVSDKSRSSIHDLLDESENHISNELLQLDVDINDYYVRKERDCPDLNTIFQKADAGFNKLPEITATDTTTCVKQIIKVIKDLGIDASMTNLSNILDYSEFIDFLKDVGRINSSKSIQIEDALPRTMQYFEDTRKWYRFIIALDDALSEYSVQSRLSEYDVTDIMDKCTVEGNEKKSISDIGLVQFLYEIECDVHHGFENMEVNSVKLNVLKNVLNQTMFVQYYVSCTHEKLVLKGYNVKMSEVAKIKCEESNKFIEVFALNKLFIDDDVDKSGEKVQLSLIAPTWEIIDKRNITLNGEDAESNFSDRARDSVAPSSSGYHGNPGIPGGSAGNILAIGNKFVNDTNLMFNLNGGHGQDGQDGGIGANGVPGSDPPIYDTLSDTLTEWIARGYHYEVLTNETNWLPSVLPTIGIRSKSYHYKAYGKHGNRPGRGGNGGFGGIGGVGGNCTIVGLNQTPSFTVFDERGENGKHGHGGSGGNATADGDVILVEFSSSSAYLLFIPTRWSVGNPRILARIEGKELPHGKNGTDGANLYGLELPEMFSNLQDPWQAVNDFKSYVRDSLLTSVRGSDLRKLLTSIEENGEIAKLYDTIGLVHDLVGLEQQYYRLRNKIDYIPYIESLLRRIGQYAKSSVIKTHTEERVLKFLYTATLSKLCAIKKNTNHISIIDLSEYMDDVESLISKLREANKDVIRTKYQEVNTISMINKMESAADFVKKQINPEIDVLFAEIDVYITKLISETKHRQNNTIDLLYNTLGDRASFEVALLLRSVFLPAKVIGSALGVITPAIKYVARGVDTFGQWIFAEAKHIRKNARGKQPPPVSEDFEASVAEIADRLKQKQELVLKQLTDTEDALIPIFESLNDPDSIKEIQDRVKEFREKIEAKKRANSYLSAEEITIMRKTLGELIARSRTKMQQELEQGTTNRAEEIIDDAIRVFYHVERLLNVAEVSIEIYNQIQRDDEKLAAFEEAIERLQIQLRMWNQHEQNIYNAMIPDLREIEHSLHDMEQEIPQKNHIVLQIQKWNVQVWLRDAKVLLHRMSKDFNVHTGLVRCIEKVEEAMTTLIDVYDRIESYMENEQLSSLILNIDSSELSNRLSTGDVEKDEVISQLRKIIQMNLILEKYEEVMHAFKQHSFPFAPIYLDKFQLPSDLEFNNTETLVANAIEQIADLKRQVNRLQFSVGKYDRELFKDIDFNSSNNSMALPFYVWKNEDTHKEISKLLMGEEITLKADINKGSQRNAVKFNEIGIHLKAKNATEQIQLDNELEHFAIVMKMVGSNYYRCGTRVYCISVDDNIVIEYTFKKDEHGQPTMSNEVYKKIQGKHYFLSPYGMWSIKIVSLNGEPVNLEKFSNISIDLELNGRGQFFKSGALEQEVCNEKLDKFYQFESAIKDGLDL